MPAPKRRCSSHHEEGIALVTTLVVLLAVLLLSASAARNVLLAERATRNERDYQIALQSAEAALADAELDIDGTAGPERARGEVFDDPTLRFSPDCTGADHRLRGLCEGGEPTAWLRVDFDDFSAAAPTVAFGEYTGRRFQSGAGSLPVQMPRYIIERLPLKTPGKDASTAARSSVYRITAVGFGPTAATSVMLQSYYRRVPK